MGAIENGSRTSLRRWFVVAALGCVSLSVSAQSGGYGYTLSGPVAAAQAAILNAQNSSKFTLAVTGGELVATSAASIPLKAGGTLAAQVAARPKMLQAAAAIGRYIKGFGPIGATALALELGFILTAPSTPGGEPVVQRSVTVNTYVAQCQGGNVSGTVETIGAACAAAAQAYWRTEGYPSCTFGSSYAEPYSNPAFMWVYLGTNGGCGFNSSRVLASPVSSSSEQQPSTLQELEDAIASKTGWPTSSTLAQTVRAAVNAGQSIETEAPTITGPATSPGSVKTSTAADGKVTTSTTVNNHTYNDNRVTTNVTTTTQVYNPSTGTTTTERVDEAPAEQEQQSECERNPNSVGCAQLDTPSGEIPRETRTVTFTPETPFATEGACPADVSQSIATLGGQTFTVWDWTKVCGYAQPLRAMVLAIATFAAALIVMPGSPRATA